jgi:ABC-type metal ion transport system substrate-binding protein
MDTGVMISKKELDDNKRSQLLVQAFQQALAKPEVQEYIKDTFDEGSLPIEIGLFDEPTKGCHEIIII